MILTFITCLVIIVILTPYSFTDGTIMTVAKRNNPAVTGTNTQQHNNQNGMVAIHPRHNKLITALRTSVENGEGSLGKGPKGKVG